MNITPMISNFYGWLIEAPEPFLLFLKITILLLIGWAGHFVLKIRNPRWRVILWRSVSIGIIILPIWSLAGPVFLVSVSKPVDLEISEEQDPVVPIFENEQSLPAFNSFSSNEISNTELSENDSQANSDELLKATTPAKPASAQQPVSLFSFTKNLPVILSFFWVMGLGAFLLRLFVGRNQIFRITQNATDCPDWVQEIYAYVSKDMNCSKRIPLKQVTKIHSPFLFGLRKPTLFLPEYLCSEEHREDLPAIFAHEISHLKSKDLHWHLLLYVQSAILWFHPLAWKMTSAHLSVCELVSDNISASMIGDASAYSRTLAKVASRINQSSPATALAMARVSDITRRLDALQKKLFDSPIRKRKVVLFSILSILFTFTIASFQLGYAENKTEQETDTKVITDNKPEEKKSNEETNPEKIAQKKQIITGKVTLPYGKPAAYADILVGRSARTNILHLKNGEWNPKTSRYKHVMADSKGAFNFIPDSEQFYIAALNDIGVAYVEFHNPKDLTELHNASDEQIKELKEMKYYVPLNRMGPLKLELLPWGRVEGKLLIGSKPGKDQKVTLSVYKTYDELIFDNRHRPFSNTYSTKTDQNGDFFFDRVYPGEVAIHHHIFKWCGPTASAGRSISAPLVVAPGEKSKVILGGTGRPVIGKIDSSAIDPNFDWTENGLGKITNQNIFNPYLKDYSFIVQQDGTFRLEDIPAGKYELTVNLNGKQDPVKHKRSLGDVIGKATLKFTVPEMPGGRSDEPLDLGIIKAQRNPKPDKVAASVKKTNKKPEQKKVATDNGVVSGTVVDEAGKPVEGAKVRVHDNIIYETKTDKEGHFRIVRSKPYFKGTIIVATHENDQLSTFKMTPDKPGKDGLIHREPVKLVLKSSSLSTVHVTDSKGNSVENAKVIAVHNKTLPYYSAVTNANGVAHIRYPAEIKFRYVSAFKAGKGYDYLINYNQDHFSSNYHNTNPILPKNVNLVLDGARTFRLRMINSAGDPIPGIKVGPKALSKKRKDSKQRYIRLRMNGNSAFAATSDINGIVEFPWFSKNNTYAAMDILSKEFKPVKSIVFDLDYQYSDNIIDVTLFKKNIIKGKVTFPDGKSAGGINIHADGSGLGGHDSNANSHAVTKEDGTYEMSVESQKAYFLYIEDKNWSAPFQQLAVWEGIEDKPLNFQLTNKTFIHGRVTLGENKTKPAGKYVSVHKDIIIPAQSLGTDKKDYIYLSYHGMVKTDEEGKYKIHVPPGEYSIRVTGQLNEKISVVENESKKQDFHIKRKLKGILEGKVHLKGHPEKLLKDITISGVVMHESQYGDLHTKTDKNGKFKTERYLYKTIVYAGNKDRSLGGIKIISADDTNVEIAIAPTADATGILADSEGDPIKNDPNLQCGIKITLGKGTLHRNGLGPHVETDENGRFHAKGLVIGQKYRLLYRVKNRFHTLKVIRPRNSKDIDLGTITFNKN